MSLLVPISSRSGKRSGETNPVEVARASASSSTADEEDAVGIVDPSLDALLLTEEPDDPCVEEHMALEVPVALIMQPRDLESVEQDNLGPDFAEGYALDDGASSVVDDDEQGPSGEAYWGNLDAEAAVEPDEPDDGPVELRTISLEVLQPLTSEDINDEEPISTRFPSLEIDDIELPWARERWAELPLSAAFSARQSLSLVGATLCAAGDTTHLVQARLFEAIEDAPLQSKVRRIICLDGEAQRLLLLTATGQLILWRRNRSSPNALSKVQVAGGEVVSMIWQQSPGSPNLLLRLDSGKLATWNDAEGSLLPVPSHSATHRLRAISEIGEPRVSLWQGNREAHLCVEVGATTQRVTLPPAMERAIADSNPILAGFVDFVLLGARDHGLFIGSTSASALTLVPGCRRFTAMAVGHVQQKPTAFVGLFSELEDRAEIVAIDLATGRAGRIAELRIHTDDAGPADDPPERARIDALLWDPSNMRLWAAGCFGLSCFAPAGTAVSS